MPIQSLLSLWDMVSKLCFQQDSSSESLLQRHQRWRFTATVAAQQSDQTNYLPCEGAAAASVVVTASAAAAVVDAVSAAAAVDVVTVVAVGLWQWRYPAVARGMLPAGSTGWTGFREEAEEP